MSFQAPFGAPAGIGGGMPQQSTTPLPQQPTATMQERVVVGPVVLSYPKLVTPDRQGDDEDGEAKYSAELYIYQDNPQLQKIMTQLHDAVNYVVRAKWPNGAPRFPNLPIRGLQEKDPAKYTGPPGFFLRANSTQRPWLGVGADRRPPVDDDEIYAGCLVYVGLTANAYQFKDKKNGNELRGVKWYLNSVLKVGDGPRLAGRVDGAKDFEGVINDIQFQFQQPDFTQQSGMTQYAPPQQMAGYPPQMMLPPGQAPQQMGYPPQQMMPPQGYPPQQMGYPPQQMMPPQGYPPQGAQPGWGPQ